MSSIKIFTNGVIYYFYFYFLRDGATIWVGVDKG
jgi:hypothetical protein